jgi:hypothetical protein
MRTHAPYVTEGKEFPFLWAFSYTARERGGGTPGEPTLQKSFAVFILEPIAKEVAIGGELTEFSY